MNTGFASVAFLLLLPAIAGAQAADEPRAIVFANAGYASTWDDEGLLGRGVSMSGGAGYSVTRRLALHVVVDRVPYYRDVEWLTFDGRVLFAGVEGSVQSQRKTVRPYVTFGYGVAANDGIWIQKTVIALGMPRIEHRVRLDGTFGAATISGGLDFRVADRTSIRAGVRWYAVHGKTDIDPYTIITPGIGVAFRW